jgi:type IV pilus assembly protein PilC
LLIYNYTAKEANGELQKGEIEAENDSTAAKILMSRGLTPISISLGGKGDLDFFNKASLKDKVIIARQLSTMISAGLPISQSLKTLEEQTSKKNIKSMLEQISAMVEGGSRLSDAFARFPKLFTGLDIAIISAGEESGNLDKSLKRLADQLEKEQSLLRKVQGALVYPIVLVVVAVFFLIAMSIYVMPQMETLYTSFGKALPFATQIMLGLSHFLTKYWYLALGFVLAATIGWVFFIRTTPGRSFWDGVKIEIPGVKTLMIKLYVARITRTLSGLISSGVPVQDALRITSLAVGNVHYESSLLEITESVKGGGLLSEALKDNRLYPVVMAQMIAVGEKTGEIDGMLSNLADYFDEEVDNAVKNITELIMPFSIIVLGLLIGAVLVSTLLPIYSFGQNL